MTINGGKADIGRNSAKCPLMTQSGHSADPRALALSVSAESQLGEVSPEKLQAVWGAVERASEADRGGDQIACRAALTDARRAFSQ
jgi:hypothetical protein